MLCLFSPIQSSQEFVNSYMCVTRNPSSLNASDTLQAKYSHLFKAYSPSQYSYSLPDEIDWRTSGAVTSIKDQVPLE